MPANNIIVITFSLFISFKTVCQPFTYQNPIIPGFNPDPSICKAGDYFYLVTSSFAYFPGVPIYRSKNLTQWEQIGYCLTSTSQLDLKKAGISSGIWAPTIRYNEGTFYMITTNQALPKNFIVTAKNPAGPWSAPIFLDIKGYDPSLYFENGKCYLTYTAGEGANGIYQCEIDPVTGKSITNPVQIWQGTGEFGTEGPHIYKIGSFYYLLVAEGGTGIMHAVSVARSTNIYGPFESNPGNPVLTNRNKRWMRIQATGHGDLIEDNNGKWWMVHLGIRKFSGFEDLWATLGRETFLLPVEWNKEGWPLVNAEGNSGEVITTSRKVPQNTSATLENWQQDFSSSKQDLNWNYIRKPDTNNIRLDRKNGYLVLKGQPGNLDSLGNISFIGRRQTHHNILLSTALNFSPTLENEEAGLTIFMGHRFHYDFFITMRNNRKCTVVRRKIDDINYEESFTPLEEDDFTILEVESNPWAYMFYLKDKNGNRKKVAHCQSYFISIQVAGGFTGMYVGLYSTGNGKQVKNEAKFDYFNYKGER